MTIAAQTAADNRTSAAGNGVTTSFSFPKPFTAQADLVVQLVLVASPYTATPQTLTTHYTISGTADAQGRYGSGANVVFLSAPSALYNVVIYADPSVAQGLDLVENDPLPAEQLELSYDKLTLLVRRLADRVARCFRLPDSSVSTGTTTLEPTASYGIGFDASKNLITYALQTGTSLISLIASGGAALIGFIAAGTGAVARTVQSKLRDTVNVADYLPANYVTDGSVNYTTYFTNAFAAAKRIRLPVGTFLVDGFSFADSSRVIEGEGIGTTTLKASASATRIIEFKGTSSGSIDNVVRNMTLDMTSMTDVSTNIALSYYKSWNNLCEKVNVVGWGTNKRSLRVGSNVAGASCYTTRFVSCDFGYADGLVQVQGYSLSGPIDQTTTITFQDCQFAKAFVDQSSSIAFSGAVVQGALTPKFALSNCDSINIVNGDIEGAAGVYLGIDATGFGVTLLKSVGNNVTTGLTYISGTPISAWFHDRTGPTMDNSQNITFPKAITATGAVNASVNGDGLNTTSASGNNAAMTLTQTGIGTWRGYNEATSGDYCLDFGGVRQVTIKTSAARFNAIGTTASAANAFLDNAAGNSLLRSTSSLRYKTDVQPVEDDRVRATLELKPIWYRSLADADRKDWSWYGMAAEDVAVVDPRLVQWIYRDTKRVLVREAVPEHVNENGAVVAEQEAFYMTVPDTDSPLVPDSVMYDRVAILQIAALKLELEEMKKRLPQ